MEELKKCQLTSQVESFGDEHSKKKASAHSLNRAIEKSKKRLRRLRMGYAEGDAKRWCPGAAAEDAHRRKRAGNLLYYCLGMYARRLKKSAPIRP